MITDAQIKTRMLENGFTLKDGLADLKPYVYQAVRAVLKDLPFTEGELRSMWNNPLVIIELMNLTHRLEAEASGHTDAPQHSLRARRQHLREHGRTLLANEPGWEDVLTAEQMDQFRVKVVDLMAVAANSSTAKDIVHCLEREPAEPVPEPGDAELFAALLSLSGDARYSIVEETYHMTPEQARTYIREEVAKARASL